MSMERMTKSGRSRTAGKVRFCCRQAKYDGLDYARIDTCCIYKPSSSELSESINSMYSWYWGSTVCYAYPEDIPGTKGVNRTGRLRNDAWRVHLAASRWFTQGWTLQELLASKNVSFYTFSWDFIGEKQHFLNEQSQTTGIAVQGLANRLLIPSTSIAQRVSWAAGRQPSRAEGRSYPMTNIFGVNMLMLYGEGSTAFQRIPVEIVRISRESHYAECFKLSVQDEKSFGVPWSSLRQSSAKGNISLNWGWNPSPSSIQPEIIRPSLCLRAVSK